MTVRSLPVVEDEQYVNREQLAALLGVSVATVDRRVAEGMPSVPVGRARRFRPSRVVAWLDDQGRDKAA